MKTMIKTLAIGLAIITMFSAMLLGGAYALSIAPVEGNTVSSGDFVDDSLFIKLNDAPMSQSDLQKKFSAYETIEVAEDDPLPGEEHKRRLTYFTEEQADELKTRKENGEIYTLTYDEILFLISDSIRAYFNYNHILLTKATEYGLTDEARRQSSPDHYILCYHGDFAELDYDTAVQIYNEMIADIYDIIVYRISMLDSKFLRQIPGMTDDGVISITDGQFLKSFDNTVKNDYLAFLATEWNNYKKKAEASISGYDKPEELALELKAPLLFANSDSSAKMIFIVDTDCLTETTLFPTVELIAKRIVPQDVIDEKYDESNYIHFYSSTARDSSLDQKLREFENQEAKENENDLLAYAIINKYLSKSYSAEAIIDSKNEDCLFMKDIIKVIKQNKLTDAESAILNSYLSRRLAWLDKDTDEILIEEINSILYNPINGN